MTTTSFPVNERVTNDNGAWATLHYDQYTDMWFADVYATNFSVDITSTRLTPRRFRSQAEKGMRQWLKGR